MKLLVKPAEIFRRRYSVDILIPRLSVAVPEKEHQTAEAIDLATAPLDILQVCLVLYLIQFFVMCILLSEQGVFESRHLQCSRLKSADCVCGSTAVHSRKSTLTEALRESRSLSFLFFLQTSFDHC